MDSYIMRSLTAQRTVSDQPALEQERRSPSKPLPIQRHLATDRRKAGAAEAAALAPPWLAEPGTAFYSTREAHSAVQSTDSSASSEHSHDAVTQTQFAQRQSQALKSANQGEPGAVRSTHHSAQRALQQSTAAGERERSAAALPRVEHPCLHEGFSRTFRRLDPHAARSHASVTLVGRCVPAYCYPPDTAPFGPL